MKYASRAFTTLALKSTLPTGRLKSPFLLNRSIRLNPYINRRYKTYKSATDDSLKSLFICPYASLLYLA